MADGVGAFDDVTDGVGGLDGVTDGVDEKEGVTGVDPGTPRLTPEHMEGDVVLSSAHPYGQ